MGLSLSALKGGEGKTRVRLILQRREKGDDVGVGATRNGHHCHVARLETVERWQHGNVDPLGRRDDQRRAYRQRPGDDHLHSRNAMFEPRDQRCDGDGHHQVSVRLRRSGLPT